MHRKRQGRPDCVEGQQVRFARALREDALVGQKHSCIRGFAATCVIVLKARRVARDVIDNQIGHHVDVGRERRDVGPRADAAIDLAVIDRVEAGIRPVDRMKEGEDVHAPEHLAQRSVQQLPKIAERAARKSIDVRDQLRLVLHGCSMATLIVQVDCLIPCIRIDRPALHKYTSAA